MASERETAAMRRALELAREAELVPNPNPRVGAVLLSPDGRVLGEGAHLGAGTPHAEVAALAAAAPGSTQGATAVVTLEPCDHTGRTGPCTEALVEAGVHRVVFGQHDPNPLAAGGAVRLRAAGVDVEGGVLAEVAEALNPAWSLAVALGRPMVTWKFAGTLDGRAAAADGTSTWITGEPARRDVARLRGECDALLVGTGTALADDPHLTVRDEHGQPFPPARQPLRVVVGRRELPADAHLRDGEAHTVQIDSHDPAEVLAALHGRGIRHVWLEGGPTLAGAFLRAGLVDEVIGYVAPLLLGAGRSVLGDVGIQTLGAGLRLTLVDVTPIGDDVRLTYFRKDG